MIDNATEKRPAQFEFPSQFSFYSLFSQIAQVPHCREKSEHLAEVFVADGRSGPRTNHPVSGSESNNKTIGDGRKFRARGEKRIKRSVRGCSVGRYSSVWLGCISCWDCHCAKAIRWSSNGICRWLSGGS